MAKVKYDVSGDIPETGNAPVGTYRGKIREAEARTSNSGNEMIAIAIELTHHADGKKVTEDWWPVRVYLMVADERPYALRGIRDFATAIGLKEKGEIDTDKIIGKSLQVKLKADTDEEGEYQPRVQKVLPLANAEEPEDEEEAEEEDDTEDVDLDTLDRSELKSLIKNNELDIKVLKSMSDDDIRAAITEALGGEEEAEEEEPEDEEEDDEEETEDVDLSALSRTELKALINDNELDIKVLKRHSDDEVRALIAGALGGEDDEEDDEEDGEEEGDTYDTMSVTDLKAELSERSLKATGTKSVLIARLRSDDNEKGF